MKCPGQDSRYWKQDAIFEAKCPKCGKEVEFFKDDTTRRCRNCGHRFLNPALDFGCASYCKYAEQCIGNLPPELIAQKENLLKDRVAIEVKRRLKGNFKQIGRTARRARYAEKIGKEEGGNLAVILSSAYLLGLAPDNGQGTEKVAAAREVLTKLGAGEALIDEVCGIVGADHDAGFEEELEFRCVRDAERIVFLEDKLKEGASKESVLGYGPERAFLTPGGRKLANEILSGASSHAKA